MDTKTFIAELIKALAWPSATVFIALLFRTPIHGVLEGIKLSKLKRGDWEAEFSEASKELQSELPTPTKNFSHTEGDSLTESLDHLLKASPTEAILAAWNKIEYTIGQLAKQHGFQEYTFTTNLNRLLQGNIIKISAKNSLLGLRQLRNLAVHGPRGEISEARAREFLTMADAILWSIQSESGKSNENRAI
ncbi:MAG: hypothetical protein WC477_02345 [Patescibacteria group bacterium]